MAKGGINGLAVGAIAVGGLLTYSGIRGTGVSATLAGLIRGQNPAAVPQLNPIVGSVAPDPGAASGAESGTESPETNPTGGAKGAEIAADALTHVGAGYIFAGKPAQGEGHWDCSSFVNKIVGMDHGLPIPGIAAGKYTGTSHGPTALMWQLWTGATTIGHTGAVAEPGDLCCWQTHIGIAIGGGEMVSARSAKDNPPTGKNEIDKAIPGEVLFIRRMKAL